MHRLISVAAVAVLGLVLVTSVGAAADFPPGPNDPPPIYVDGARAVDIRNTDGTMTRHYTIPSASLFRTEGNGAACRFVPPYDGVASNGERYVAGQVVYSEHWIFVESTLPSFFDPTPADTVVTAPLADARRTFIVYCDSLRFPIDMVAADSRDPMIDPRSQLDRLRNDLRLVRPVVFTNPVVERWGGLVTRYPAWLAVLRPAWTSQRSTVAEWRGWSMSLVASPVALDFVLTFRPDPERPSPAFSGVVPCIRYGASAVIGGVAVPAMPELPDQSVPGVNGDCMWTPPGPGTVTIQARISYRITFWANAYYEAQPDYLWTSLPVTFATGELAAVNVGSRS